MKNLLIAFLALYGLALNAQNIQSPVEHDSIRQSFIHIGVGAQAKRTSVDLGIGWRNKHMLIMPGIVGSIYHLTGTQAYEYSMAAKVNLHHHFLNYGFLNSWPRYHNQKRWTPYINFGVAVGTRYIQNRHLIIYELDRWNLLIELEASVGVKYSPKDIFNWHTNGYLTFQGDIGVINSTLDGQYLNFSLGISHVFGY